MSRVHLLCSTRNHVRSDRWLDALRHYVDFRNHTPNKHTPTSTPHREITGECTDLNRLYEFAFGDLVAVGIPKELKTWKFDVKNHLAIYVGQPEGYVDAHLIYRPYERDVIIRGSVQLVNVTDTQFLRWYTRRVDMLTGKTPYREISDALLNFADPELELIIIEDDQAAIDATSTADISEKSPVPPSDRTLRSSSRSASAVTAHSVIASRLG